MTITGKDIADILEIWAPRILAESWDNPGLSVGDLDRKVTGIITTLDVTEGCIERAIEMGSNFIISHHPLIFKGLKSIDERTSLGRCMSKLIRNHISVYSVHTNLDIAEGGLNDMVAQNIGLTDIKGLVLKGKQNFFKVVCYVPVEYADSVRKALGIKGAGQIGDYSSCSFSVEGTGRFMPLEGSNPFIGETNKLEEVAEERIEVLVEREKLGPVLKEMLQVHPYEEPAYEVYPLEAPSRKNYLGRWGKLSKALDAEEFIKSLQQQFPQSRLRFAGKTDKKVEVVALCTGAGASFAKEALAVSADVYITGDVKYHEAQFAVEQGLLLVDAGHFGTEAIVAEGIKSYLEFYGKKNGVLLPPVLAFIEQEDFFTYL